MLDVDVDVDFVIQQPSAALQRVLHVVPGWDEACAQEAQVEQLSGAMTNLVFRCHSPSAQENATVIVRVFGRGGKLFSQRQEQAIFARASALGLGAKCLAQLPSARVEEFLPGKNLTAQSMREPVVAAAIARAMASFHVQMLRPEPAAGVQQVTERASVLQNGGGAHCSGGTAGEAKGLPADRPAAVQQRRQQWQEAAAGPGIWERIRKWHALALEVAAPEVERLGLTDALQEVDRLEASFASRFPLWLGFSHNDLQYGNMLLFAGGSGSVHRQSNGSCQSQQRQQHAPELAAPEAAAGAEDGDGPTVCLIDYDYCTLNDVAYDVGNHWCEYTYDYHSDTPDTPDWSKFPSHEEQRAFCTAYLAALQQLLDSHQQAQQRQQQCRKGLGWGTDMDALAPEDSAFCGASLAAKGLPAGNGCDEAATTGSSGALLSATGVALLDAILGQQEGQRGQQQQGQGQQQPGKGATNGKLAVGVHGGPASSPPLLDLLIEKALAYSVLTHLKWSLWGLIQDKLSDVDFDYAKYASLRALRYHETKSAYLQ